MAKYRQGKINDAVMQALSESVREIKDPRVIARGELGILRTRE